MKPNAVILIRVDSAVELGSGHLRRCLTLAIALRDLGANVHFICRNLPGHVSELVAQLGFGLTLIEGSQAHVIDWKKDSELTLECAKHLAQIHCEPVAVVLDHYYLDAKWEVVITKGLQLLAALYPHKKCAGLFVIDDLANRTHHCDFILDQNFYQDQDIRYKPWIPQSCKALLGPSFALLKPEFATLRANFKRSYTSVNEILLFFGGTDPKNQTLRVLKLLEANIFLIKDQKIKLSVVMGGTNPFLAEVKSWIDSSTLKLNGLIDLHVETSDMANLMFRADLSIGAGGTTHWERLCAGLPTLILSLADNQVQVSEDLDAIGAISYLGHFDQVSDEKILEKLKFYLEQTQLREQMSKIGSKMVDGRGTQKIAGLLINS